jgi:hypothetical protein
MQAMTFPEKPLEWRALAVAVVVSLAIHGLILFVNYQKPTRHGNSLPRIEASLARQPAPVALPPPAPARRRHPKNKPSRQTSRKPDRE